MPDPFVRDAFLVPVEDRRDGEFQQCMVYDLRSGVLQNGYMIGAPLEAIDAPEMKAEGIGPPRPLLWLS
jgi:hypothetical protein